MTSIVHPGVSAVRQRLSRCFDGEECNWDLFYKPRQERSNFATRYHLVYPGLAYFILLRRHPEARSDLRSKLDTMFRGLLHPRSWSYWHTELQETSWPLQERNLTYAGRLATFVGFYIDAFGEPPAELIEVDGRSITYSDLSESLHRQMIASPNCGVSCYHHESMVMCNAHMLINNILHDRLFGTRFASCNVNWLKMIDDHLTRDISGGPLFYFGTRPNEARAAEEKQSLGADIWALFLMSSVVPEKVRGWFRRWQDNITCIDDRAYIAVSTNDAKIEFASNMLSSAWAYCLAKELGEVDLARMLRRTLDPGAVTGFELDPLISGLYLLGEHLEPGAFHQLVTAAASSTS